MVVIHKKMQYNMQVVVVTISHLRRSVLHSVQELRE